MPTGHYPSDEPDREDEHTPRPLEEIVRDIIGPTEFFGEPARVRTVNQYESYV